MQPQIIDDNWLAEAIVAKMGPDNLLSFGPDTYIFDTAWRCLDQMALSNMIRREISRLNELRAERNLKLYNISASRVS